MEYRVTVFASKYMKVGEEYQNVEMPLHFHMKDYDAVQNLIGYMVEGSERIRIEIKKVEEEA